MSDKKLTEIVSDFEERTTALGEALGRDVIEELNTFDGVFHAALTLGESCILNAVAARLVLLELRIEELENNLRGEKGRK